MLPNWAQILKSHLHNVLDHSWHHDVLRSGARLFPSLEINDFIYFGYSVDLLTSTLSGLENLNASIHSSGNFSRESKYDICKNHIFIMSLIFVRGGFLENKNKCLRSKSHNTVLRNENFFWTFHDNISYRENHHLSELEFSSNYHELTND